MSRLYVHRKTTSNPSTSTSQFASRPFFKEESRFKNSKFVPKTNSHLDHVPAELQIQETPNLQTKLRDFNPPSSTKIPDRENFVNTYFTQRIQENIQRKQQGLEPIPPATIPAKSDIVQRHFAQRIQENIQRKQQGLEPIPPATIPAKPDIVQRHFAQRIQENIERKQQELKSYQSTVETQLNVDESANQNERESIAHNTKLEQPSGIIQRKCAACEAESKLMPKETGDKQNKGLDSVKNVIDDLGWGIRHFDQVLETIVPTRREPKYPQDCKAKVLIRYAEKCGMNVVPGGNHWLVYKNGRPVTVIPHRMRENNTCKQIIRDLIANCD